MSNGKYSTNRRTRSTIAATTLGLWASVVTAGLLPPPSNVIWVGSDAACDYATIDDALDNLVEECDPIFGCPIGGGRPEVRVALNYSTLQSQPALLDTSVVIAGGYESCEGPFSVFLKTRLDTIATAFVVDGAAASPIDVELRNLFVVGRQTPVANGGGLMTVRGSSNLSLLRMRLSEGAASQGGAVAITETGGQVGVTMTDTRIDTSFATNGAGVAISGSARLTLRNTRIDHNEAGEFGGGIYCEDEAIINFDSGQIESNFAGRYGGGVALFDCTLLGRRESANRFIQFNKVRFSEPGKGGGVYAVGSYVGLGALNSITAIHANEVLRPSVPREFNGETVGGGMHIQGSTAVLDNVRLTWNQAPAGGALSATQGSRIYIDRIAGPCPEIDDPDRPAGANPLAECSLIANNLASGRRIGFSYAGVGSVMWGFANVLEIQRTSIRNNQAICNDGDDCDDTSGSLIQANGLVGGDRRFSLRNNLIYDNFVDSICDTDCDLGGAAPVTFIHGPNFDRIDLRGNTLFRNRFTDVNDGDVDTSLLRPSGAWSLVGNIIWDNDFERLAENESAPETSVCNVSDMGDLNIAVSEARGNSDQNPMFINEASFDLRLLANSPALNRCDDRVVGGLTRTYDVAGRLRPRTHGNLGAMNDYFDSGGLEQQIASSSREVDLAISIAETGDSPRLEQPYEIEYRVQSRGLNEPGTVSVAFAHDEGFSVSGISWSCQELSARSTLCDYTGSLPTPITSAALNASLITDTPGTCRIDARAIPDDDDQDVLGFNDSLTIDRSFADDPDLLFRGSMEPSCVR